MASNQNSQDTGKWLRRHREARGWTRRRLARQLTEAGQAQGELQLPDSDSMCRNIYRWERGGSISERYRELYCVALDIPYGMFGVVEPGDACPSPDMTSKELAGVVLLWADGSTTTIRCRSGP